MDSGSDFLDLLKDRGYQFPIAGAHQGRGLDAEPRLPFEPTEGTTILGLRYRDGVLIAGDRRATAGNSVVTDRANKVIDIDSHSVLAISGSPAMAYEIARILEHSFQYHRRRQLQEMSLEAKVRRLSLLIRDNLPMAMQGIGAVIPIFATFDRREERGKIFFYDALGAQFESTDFATTGSGSPGIRGVLFYLNQWGERPFADMDRDVALALVLRLLHTASEHDAATGRYEGAADVQPSVKAITSEGLQDVSGDEIMDLYERFVKAKGGPAL